MTRSRAAPIRWSAQQITSGWPVLLTKPEEFDQWLNGTPAEALELAREYPPELMRIVQEGFDKEDLLQAA